MMSRRKISKVLCIGLSLLVAFNLLLVFSTKGTLQKLLLASIPKGLHSPEWEGAVIQRLSHLEVDLQQLSKFPVLTWRGGCPCTVVCVHVHAMRSRKKEHEGRGVGERLCSYLLASYLNILYMPTDEREVLRMQAVGKRRVSSFR